MNSPEVLIIGGGLAGLTAALDLSKKGKKVLVVEKNKYPNHKVCGEYVSNEVKPYLTQLGVILDGLELPKIDTLHLSTQKGKQISVKLPLGGFGISRYAFDHQLYLLAMENGVGFIFATVENVQYKDDRFLVKLSSKEEVISSVVIGAYGKRSNIDMKLKRDFIQQKSPWLGIKCHYVNNSHPSNVVGLHSFPGGYGGLSLTEKGDVNFCCLVKYENFKKEKDIASFNKNVVYQNPVLKDFLSRATPKFEKHLSIAQISFEKKQAVYNHIVMCGDTAGLIHPLCGNGMAMAIHSAKLAAEQVFRFLEEPDFSRMDMEKSYQKLWTKNFNKRIWIGRQLQQLMLHTKWFNFGMNTAANSKVLLRSLIRNTHGTPILN
ncbi:NAD(P)/FAD-dependent oxidoreductase [Flagellimonas pacifica]|uniref:Dehydrogenase (Flavoprotein) n=1 Tax=Flagellimonas pacifica TaxID=1247520 RepID=A0A285MS33_9FLAO|nr:NAD(P)/FAD-dependent oxidoreductase [Allomuricauda parva]SNZ00002.1 Dehydrogenase (flavoprotein) [Allomuricauda parva]